MADIRELAAPSDDELLAEEQIRELSVPEDLNEKAAYDYVHPAWIDKMSPMDRIGFGAKQNLKSKMRGIEGLMLDARIALHGNASDKLRKSKLEEARVKSAEDAYHFSYDPDYKLGNLGGEITTGLAVPGGGVGKTILSTAARAMPANALFNALTTEGSKTDRVVAGVTGAVGGAAGTGAGALVGKGGRMIAPRLANAANRLLGRPATRTTAWQNIDDVSKQMIADRLNMPLSAGDIRPGGPYEHLENWLASGKEGNVLAEQAAAIKARLRPKNAIKEGVEQTKKGLSLKADQIYQPVRDMTSKASLMVPTDNMHSSFSRLYTEHPSLFSGDYMSTGNKDLLKRFMDNPEALTFAEFSAVKQAIGGAQKQAQTLVNQGAIDPSALGMAKGAYADASKDLRSWGASGTSKSTKAKYKKIVDALERADKRWMNEIAPFRHEGVTKKLLDAETPEQTMKAVLDPMNNSGISNVVLPQLDRYSSDTADLVRYLGMTNRAGKAALGEAPIQQTHPLSFAKNVFTHPLVSAAQQFSDAGTSSRLVKDAIFGKFDDLVPKGSSGVLQNLAATVPASVGRQYDEQIAGGALGTYSLLKDMIFPKEDKSWGSLNSTRNDGNVP